MALKAALVVMAACGVCWALGADPREPVQAVRLEKPVTLDGVIDEAGEWAGVPALEGLYDLENGSTAADSAKFWLAYDGEFIYFAARLHDSNPGSIKAQQYQTNVSLEGDDAIYLDLDPSAAYSEINSFGVNPRGATEIYLAGGRAAKREWTGEFLAQARITPEGWEAEARIPWKVLRLPASGKRTVLFNFTRAMPRHQRQFVWADISANKLNQMGKWVDVELPKQEARRTLQLLPYLYAGINEDGDHIANAGLDLKTQVTDQVALVGTVNPDFRNVENSILSLDFSRFERLGTETRPFFLEGSQYMNTALFASQRIRQFDVGVNVHGKLSDKVSFGVLDTVDFGNRNSLLANVSYAVDSTSGWRASFTSLSTPTAKNDAYLLRYIKSFGPASLFLRTMGSNDTARGLGVWHAANAFFDTGKYNGYLTYGAISPDFTARLGFVPETNLKGFQAGARATETPKKGILAEYEVGLDWLDFDRYHGGHYRTSWSPSVELGLRNGLEVELRSSWDEFEGVRDRMTSVNLSYPRTDRYNNVGVGYSWGEFAEERFKSINVNAAWRPTPRLQITGSYQKFDHFQKSDQAIIGYNYDLGNNFFLSGRAVKRDQDWNAYISFRRSGNRGVEHYLIIGDPNAQTFQRTVILKVVMPMNLNF